MASIPYKRQQPTRDNKISENKKGIQKFVPSFFICVLFAVFLFYLLSLSHLLPGLSRIARLNSKKKSISTFTGFCVNVT